MASLPAGSHNAMPAAASETAWGDKLPIPLINGSLVTRPPPQTSILPQSRGSASPPPLKKLASFVSSSRSGYLHAQQTDRSLFTNASFDVAIPCQRVSVSATLSPETPETLMGQASSVPTSSWTVRGLVERLKECRKEVREGHAVMTAHAIASASAVAPERRVFTGRDLFAGVKMRPVAEKKGRTMRIKFKQHLKAKKETREEHYDPVCIKTNTDAVPPYRFHHVEIKKNILTPNTMLTFVPYLRDLEGEEEAQHNLWLQELDDIEYKSGFKPPMKRQEKHALTAKMERAATISLYLDSWLDSLAIPHCTRSSLTQYMMATKKPDDDVSPQSKESKTAGIVRSQRRGEDILTPEALKAAEMFDSAFRLAFVIGQQPAAVVHLRDALLVVEDESAGSAVETCTGTKSSAAKEASASASSPARDDNDSDNDNGIDELVESSLATYCLLGCLICFSHSCDHGEYDNKNAKCTFSLSACSPLAGTLKRKRALPFKAGGIIHSQCRRKCYRREGRSDAETQGRDMQWTEDERSVLRSLYITSENSRLRLDPICLVADILNRDCSDVFAEFNRLSIQRPEAGPAEIAKARNLPWYDRRKKMLIGDWHDQTKSSEHHKREMSEPCFHAGPCAPNICSCVDADILCEKFCGCTVETCSYKFTGCACHAQSPGKACHSRQKDRPCICVQLNRECDPDLCGSCGVLARADPANEADDELHSTGCQNCELQRGPQTTLLLGRSQLEGVGYGLFTAQDIAQDGFVIEYVGELITHDEGVRREARRGNVFDEESNTSYVFTLLEQDGIWVDAAIYGNLSRYINHASEQDTRGCNITPRILYVNGEYRIKFTALRDIKAGEELFFNYGENFPNLTKKLLDHSSNKASENPGSKNKNNDNNKASGSTGPGVVGEKRKPGRPRRLEPGDRVARKAPKMVDMAEKRAMTARKTIRNRLHTAHGAGAGAGAGAAAEEREPLKRKRNVDNDGDGGDDPYDGGEYLPPAAKSGSGRAAAGGSEDSDAEPLMLKKRTRRLTRLESSPKTGTARSSNPKVSSSGTAASPGGRHRESRAAARRPEPVEVIEIEDSDFEDVAMGGVRAARTRRMPAKFRDHEVHFH